MVLLAYLGVALIWMTTPLAIQWSGDGVGFIFGVTARMVIGTSLAMAVVLVFRLPMAWHRDAQKTYLASAVGIYGAMLAVYFGSRYIPSGWISVIFGLNPILTGLLAWKMLGEWPFSAPRLGGMVIGLIGLAVIFYTGWEISDTAWIGVLAVLTGVILHSLSMVLVKRGKYHPNGLVIATGGLMMATPAYLLTWLILDGEWPAQIPTHAAASIVYLGSIATVLGFSLFYFVLKHVDATRVALLTLLTPVLALWLGHVLNQEVININVLSGTLLILVGLALYELSGRFTAGRL